LSGSREAALKLAGRVLAQRDCSRSALVARLVRAGIDADEAASVLEELSAAGYVDDERFAADRAASLAGRGYGNAAIAAKLRAEAVPSAVIDNTVAQLPPEDERARDLVGRKRAGSDRLGAMLQRRGYSTDAIEAVLRSVDDQDRPSLR
jgi:regulatory protein